MVNNYILSVNEDITGSRLRPWPHPHWGSGWKPLALFLLLLWLGLSHHREILKAQPGTLFFKTLSCVL